MNTVNIEKIKQEINKLYIPYWERTFDFVKNFAKEKNIILTEEEINYIVDSFKEEHEDLLFEFNEDVVLFKEPPVLDWTDKFEKTPTLQEVRAYIKKLVDECTKFATLSPDWFIDVRGNREKRKHIVNSSKRRIMSRVEVQRHNKYIMSLDELVNNSLYLNSETNRKIDKKPDIEKYHYFESKVKIGLKEYKIILHTEQYIGEKENKPQTVHLYDVLEVNKKTSRT
ncbi:MAG: hypothetical protein II816_02045 [Elusimicrobia bacterium]|nr:hypothetical protein [Elusimicrobiota bacterium]